VKSLVVGGCLPRGRTLGCIFPLKPFPCLPISSYERESIDMTISSVSPVSTVPDSSYQNGVQQRQSEFQQLAQALWTGNLSNAQSAYNALTQNSSSPTSPSNSNSEVAQDWTALGQALQSGDLSSAQQAFSKLQTDAASTSSSGSAQAPAQGAHRGHHHHHHVDSNQTTSSTSSTTGSLINVTA